MEQTLTIIKWMPRFDFEKFLEYNKKFRITFFFSVPPIYLLIAKMPNVTDQFDYLECAYSGAAPLGKDLQHAASAKLGRGNTFISQTWGLSETTGSVTAMPWHRRDETGSVSELLPNMSVRLVHIWILYTSLTSAGSLVKTEEMSWKESLARF